MVEHRVRVNIMCEVAFSFFYTLSAASCVFSKGGSLNKVCCKDFFRKNCCFKLRNASFYVVFL